MKRFISILVLLICTLVLSAHPVPVKPVRPLPPKPVLIKPIVPHYLPVPIKVRPVYAWNHYRYVNNAWVHHYWRYQNNLWLYGYWNNVTWVNVNYTWNYVGKWAVYINTDNGWVLTGIYNNEVDAGVTVNEYVLQGYKVKVRIN